MVSFLSPEFLLFFPIVTLLYFLLPCHQLRAVWLLACSWFFYAWASPVYLLFLLSAIAVTYLSARWMAVSAGARKRAVLIVTLLLLFGALFLFKYLDFALNLTEKALQMMNISGRLFRPRLILPAGISFYLFMAAGYLIDVYRDEKAEEKNLLYLALFLSFFPYLLSGPIGRAKALLPQFREKHVFDYDKFRTGLLRFLWGAFVKLVLADRLAILVNTVYAAPGDFGALQVIAAACAFSVQIYCDFSAYSHMALGLGEALGFTFMENFRTPYFARTIGEFWRRWHISLSSWFRDYLYIPLGGSRKGKGRTYFNLLAVFAVSGLWHGASVAFLAWGLLNGCYQVIGSLTLPLREKGREKLHLASDGKITVLWQIGVTFILSTIAWVFFQAGSFTHALEIFRAMVSGPLLTHPISAWGLGWKEVAVLAAGLCLLLGVDLASLKGPVRLRVLSLRRLYRWCIVLFLLLGLLIFGVYGGGYDPQSFIYFNF